MQRWIALGAVRVDQALRLPSYRLNGHEEIEVEPQPLESEQAFCPDPVPLDILHRDDDLRGHQQARRPGDASGARATGATR